VTRFPRKVSYVSDEDDFVPPSIAHLRKRECGMVARFLLEQLKLAVDECHVDEQHALFGEIAEYVESLRETLGILGDSEAVAAIQEGMTALATGDTVSREDFTAAICCTTLCDDDCEAQCHESHVVTWKREHDPDNCPSRLRGPS
jgi:hypothetical protein